MSTLGNKRVELFDMGIGAGDPIADENVQVASGGITYQAFLYKRIPFLTFDDCMGKKVTRHCYVVIFICE